MWYKKGKAFWLFDYYFLIWHLTYRHRLEKAAIPLWQSYDGIFIITPLNILMKEETCLVIWSDHWFGEIVKNSMQSMVPLRWHVTSSCCSHIDVDEPSCRVYRVYQLILTDRPKYIQNSFWYGRTCEWSVDLANAKACPCSFARPGLTIKWYVWGTTWKALCKTM